MNAQKVIGGITTTLTRAGQVFPFVANRIVTPGIYWGKVIKEVAKEVWVKEKMNPPSIAQVQTVYNQINTFVRSITFKQARDEARALNAQKVVGVGIVGLQILGFFSVGEMIGRRGILGYNIKV